MGNPYVTKTEQGLAITAEGLKLLDDLVTDTSGNIYAFRPSASPFLVSAAMARLSRSANDLRLTYLNEFAYTEENAGDFLEKVVTGYGDDSVQQLMPVQVVVEGASNLLTKILEWPRFGSYLEQSTRYIPFDGKVKGKYRYYTPPNLPEELAIYYNQALDKIFGLYSEMLPLMIDFVRAMNPEPEKQSEKIPWRNATRAKALDAVRVILPTATTSSVGIVGSSQAIENLIYTLSCRDLVESQDTGRRMLEQVRMIAPSFFSRTDMPDRGGAIVHHKKKTRASIREAVSKLRYLPSAQGPDSKVKLLDYYPQDELEIVADILYPQSTEDYHSIRDRVNSMSTEEQQAIVRAYIGERMNRRHKPGRAFENIHYKWEITGDYGTFRDLQRHRVVDGFEWQNLRTDIGFEIPQLVQDAGYSDFMDKALTISERLYHRLVSAGFTEEAQYATLLGHEMRYKFMINARATYHLHELRSGPEGHPGYRRIVNLMHGKVEGVHPVITSGMIFMNKQEDLALARLAGEKATQAKLALLGVEHVERE